MGASISAAVRNSPAAANTPANLAPLLLLGWVAGRRPAQQFQARLPRLLVLGLDQHPGEADAVIGSGAGPFSRRVAISRATAACSPVTVGALAAASMNPCSTFPREAKFLGSPIQFFAFRTL